MMKKRLINNKKLSMIVCALLVMSILAVIPAATAWEHSPQDTANVHGNNMVEIINTGAGSDSPPFYVGQQGVEFSVIVRNINNPDDPLAHNPTLNAVRFNVQEVRGPDGAVTTSALDWEVDEDEGPYSIAVGATAASDMLEFSIADNTDDVPPGEYTIVIRVRYDYDHNDDGDETAANEIEHLVFEIANNADVGDVDAEDSDNLWAGENFQEVSVNVENDGGELLDDASLTLSGLPNGVTITNPTARIPAGILAGEDEDFFYRVDVDSDVPPGIYSIDYTFTATRDGVDITEEGEIDLVVDFTPKIIASLNQDVVIEQGTIRETVEVTFENAGNVDLEQLYIGMISDDDYFPIAVAHYEYGDEVYPMPQFVGNLGVGATTSLEFETGFHRYIQEGTHMIQFRWDGWYFDDGSTDEATRYYHVGVDWIDADPDRGVLYEVEVDNHMYAPGPGGDTLLEDPWTAPHVLINVVDDVIDMEAFIADAIGISSDITYIEVEVTILNFELVSFRDLEVVLNVGPGTPFLNPQDRTLTTVSMHRGESADSIDAFEPGVGPGEADIVFYVSVNSEYVTSTLGGFNHAYVGSMVITSMINENTLQEVTDQVIPLSGELVGFGPRVVVEGRFSDNHVIAGEVFDIQYTITNHGDDIARDTWITMIPELYDNEPWTIHDGFVRAIASDGTVSHQDGMNLIEIDTSNKSTEWSGVTLETLNIDSAKEIVELHMYVEGALSSPRPYIGVVYIGELAPGDEVIVNFEMLSDRDMQIGKPYQETILIECIDSNGIEWEWEYPLTIRTRIDGEEYDPDTTGLLGGAEGTMLLIILGAIVLVIVLAILVAMRKDGGSKPKKEAEPEPEAEKLSELQEIPESEYEVYEEDDDLPPPYEEEVPPPPYDEGESYEADSEPDEQDEIW